MLSVRARATLLLYAALQFVVLSLVAMRVYGGGSVFDPLADGYTFFGNFLSDLGATRSWSGQSNTAAMLLFGFALASVGLAFIGFAPAWRAFAFAKGRARIAGVASQWFGTASGAAFVAVALTPVNQALDAHNTLVICAFALLLAYSACLTIVWAKNGAGPVELAASGLYLLAVIAYFVVTALAIRAGIGTRRSTEMLIVSQKIFCYGSMAYVGLITTLVRSAASGR